LKKKKAQRLDKTFKVCRAKGFTDGQIALGILGVYADRGRLGSNVLRVYQRLVREEQEALRSAEINVR
jgi:hypothetical protein